MTQTLQKLSDLINQSSLSNEDKEDFVFFIQNISDEESEQLISIFNESKSKIEPFWMDLKKKLIFMELLDSNTDFSDEAKNDIKQKISEMTPEEFDVFLSTIQEISEGADMKQKMSEILEQSKKNEEELSSLTKKLTSE